METYVPGTFCREMVEGVAKAVIGGLKQQSISMEKMLLYCREQYSEYNSSIAACGIRRLEFMNP